MRAAAWLGRPDNVLDRSRLVLGVLTVCSLLFAAPFMIASSGDDRPAVVVSLLVLLTTLVVAYRTARVRSAVEVVEAACVCTMMAALPSPLMAFCFLFPLLWCRALYGGGLQMLVRSGLQMAGLLLAVPLSRVLFQPVEPDLTTFLVVGMASIVFIGVAGRQLAIGMHAHDTGARRERLLSASGTRLLGITDQDTIRQINWETVTALVAPMPGVRLLSMYGQGQDLAVVDSLGAFTALPAGFTRSELGLPSEGAPVPGPPRPVAALNRAAGQSCQWVVHPFVGAGTGVVVALGHPGRLDPKLLPAVVSVTIQGILARQNGAAHRELATQALTDGLTGLANRQGFTEATRRLIATAGDTPTAVLFVDLDDFKEVNDTLGHHVGDDLLQQVADLLTSVTRADDIVARLGGDEFAVLLRNTPQQVAEQVAQRIVLGVSVLSVASGTYLSVGASIGVAMARADTALENLLVHADVAMYAAKSGGKGQIQVYHPSLLRATGTITA